MKPLYSNTQFENSKYSDLLPCQCYFCSESFLRPKKEIKFELKHQRGRIKFCSTSCLNKYNTSKNSCQVKCLNCNKKIKKKNSDLEKTKNSFCSSSCSAIFNNKKRDTTKQQKTLNDTLRNEYNKDVSQCFKCESTLSYKDKNKLFCDKCYINITDCKNKRYSTFNPEYNSNPNKCTICNKDLNYGIRFRKTCSEECCSKILSISSRNNLSNLSKKKRSKNEELFAKKCKKHFKEVLTNEPIFNGWDADVIIEDSKIAVLWNGVWHYKKITDKHSVKQVQNRDKIKIKEIKKAGYTPYVIKDMGKFSKEKVNMEFEKFIKFLQNPS